MRVVWRQGREWTSVLRSGRREPDRCYQGRMRRYPDCLASGPGLSQQGAQRLRLRIDRSIVFQFICKDRQKRTRGLTKKRIPSASFCQRSTILLSSSSAALEYMEKSGPELTRSWILLPMAAMAYSVSTKSGRYLFYIRLWDWREAVKATNNTHLSCSPSRGLHEQFETLRRCCVIRTELGRRPSKSFVGYLALIPSVYIHLWHAGPWLLMCIIVF
jgi:hypothetical protein